MQWYYAPILDGTSSIHQKVVSLIPGPRLQVRSPFWAWRVTNRCFLSHWCFLPSLPFSLYLSLSLPLSEINKHNLEWGLKKKDQYNEEVCIICSSINFCWCWTGWINMIWYLLYFDYIFNLKLNKSQNPAEVIPIKMKPGVIWVSHNDSDTTITKQWSFSFNIWKALCVSKEPAQTFPNHWMNLQTTKIILR